MESRGLTDMKGNTISTDREGSSRNVMTSIIFMGTPDAPILYFGINKSDHVHYYHGGDSYTYIVAEQNGRVYEVTLGPDVQNELPDNCVTTIANPRVVQLEIQHWSWYFFCSNRACKHSER